MSTKKTNLTNIRTANVHGPVLVSPISVAHRALEADKKGENNQVRAQWIANLKKKSMSADMSNNNGHTGASQDSLTSQQQHLMMNASEKMGFLDHDFRNGVKVEPKSNAHIDVMPKKWIKPLMKKRNNLLDLHNAPKPRTPRRKLNCGNAFEEMHIHTSSPVLADAAWHGFPGVGTPSAHYHNNQMNPNPNHPMASVSDSNIFGHDIDFGNFDTFLDLPTPKSAEMATFAMMDGAPSAMEQYQLPPTLVRTSSIEQEGLSYFFEQTRLNSNQRFESPRRKFSGSSEHGSNSSTTESTSPECIFDHSKHPELEGMFDFNDADIEKEVDSFYMDGETNDLEIDLIA